MRTKLPIVIILSEIIIAFCAVSFAASPFAVSLPQKPPGTVAKIIQKDKPAIVLVDATVTGTVLFPTFLAFPEGGPIGNVFGSWQSQVETLILRQTVNLTAPICRQARSAVPM